MLSRFVEWYLGIQPAAPGQGTDWSLQSRLPLGPIPLWATAFLVLLFCVVVFVVYRWEADHLPRRRRWLLTSLRLLVLAVLLLFLSQATLRNERTGLPVVALMLDDSASMGLEDRYTDPQQARAVDGWKPADSSGQVNRLALVKAILSADEGRFLRELIEKYKIKVYTFSDKPTPLGQGQYVNKEELPSLLSALAEVNAVGEQTALGLAARQVLEDFRGTPPAAVIVFTDGVASTDDGDRLSSVASIARQQAVPFYPVGIGSTLPPLDLYLHDMLVDEVAFVNDPIQFLAKVKAFGTHQEEVLVRLVDQATGKVLATKAVALGSEGEPVKLELTYTPLQPGEYDFQLIADPIEEESNKLNNREVRHISVRRDRIRVLLVDSVPRYEFRYLKHLLERDRTVDLKTVLQSADLEYTQEDETALKQFPIQRDELFSFDVVILGDVDPQDLGSGSWQHLEQFLSEKGGGLIFIAGERHNPEVFRGTPLEAVLPIELADVSRPDPLAASTVGFRPSLTPAAVHSSLFRFADTQQKSREIWNSLAELYWYVSAPSLRPGAVALAVHPGQSMAQGSVPIISLQRFGAGKVIFHATDESWRWRIRMGERYYGHYWIQTIRFLSRSRLLGEDRAAELSADRRVYSRGETAQLQVRFHDEQIAINEQRPVSVIIETPDGSQQTVELSRQPDLPRSFSAGYKPVQTGSYHAWIAEPSFTEAPPSADFRVEAPVKELLRRDVDQADLELTAKKTRGQCYSLAEVDKLPQHLPPGRPVPLQSGTPIPLWNRWELITLFCGLLAAEWILRKRSRLV